ncbi:nitrogenase iron-iron protein beta chain [Ruminiclostridium hungatei]|uniref:Nitrogenase iron-iron protein beta chain n=1 Tax=Ruminiclostridium hungatei TaxID=48256 RepID=A0A1V4SKH4_RUMHU|nr:nitrogenase component 1 [Ruminiclostridium hungatei]OPX43996.1 nitrogenase iron-iron protein beta chain [Ruminiclostridium hungatei]
MSKFIDRPRYLCALGGAIGTLENLPRTIPILHAAAGCGGNISNALNYASGYLGSGYCAGQALSSSNVYEQEIVFGGEDRLCEQVENTLKIMDGDLYFLVSGCMVEMIGDDVKGVAKKFKDRDVALLAADTGGFHGNSFKGYDIVLGTLFKEFTLKKDVKNEKLLNLWGIVPIQDVFWKGNLENLKRLLEELGYQVNTFFGENETLDNLKNAGSAVLNIVVSDTAGIEPAKLFEEVHGVPYISVPLPIGPHGTEQFIRSISNRLGIEKAFADKVIQRHKARYFSYIERIADVYNDLDLQRYAVIVGDSSYAQALTRFLSDDLGWLPELVVITDILSEEQKEDVRKRFADLESGLSPRIVFDTDTSSIIRHFRDTWPSANGSKYFNTFSPAFILGSAFERALADELKAPHLSVTYPISNRVVMDRAYTGYDGAIRLTEDIFTTLVGTR